jgi:protein-tyrosine phosphatase
MIDLHTHILPGIDDGPADMEESLAMVRMGWEAGIHTICATPHLMEAPSEEIVNRFASSFQALKERVSARGLPINLLLGAEVYFQPRMEKILGFPRLTLNGTGKYILLEFPMQGIPAGAESIIFDLIMGGGVPIVAHPERNLSVLKDEAVLQPIVRMGALIQVNAGSLEGQFGKQVKKTALSLLKKGLVQLVGSDAHNALDRAIQLRGAVESAAQVVGPDIAQLLVTANPERILAGEALPSYHPLPPESPRSGLLHKVWRGMTGK